MSCIHWVDRSQLAPLEYVMRHFLSDRVQVGVMLAGMGQIDDVFTTTQQFTQVRGEERRGRRQHTRTRTRMRTHACSIASLLF